MKNEALGELCADDLDGAMGYQKSGGRLKGGLNRRVVHIDPKIVRWFAGWSGLER